MSQQQCEEPSYVKTGELDALAFVIAEVMRGDRRRPTLPEIKLAMEIANAALAAGFRRSN